MLKSHTTSGTRFSGATKITVRAAAARATLAATVALVLAVAFTPAASADYWAGGCTGVYSGTCVHATVGSKNYSNHTQWVGWVQANAYGTAGITKLEVWGDGFYYATGVNPSTNNPSAQWGAQRWVHSGTYVCAASTSTSGYRDVACIGITV